MTFLDCDHIAGEDAACCFAFLLICNKYAVSLCLLFLVVIGRLFSGIVVLSGHLLCYILLVIRYVTCGFMPLMTVAQAFSEYS